MAFTKRIETESLNETVLGMRPDLLKNMALAGEIISGNVKVGEEEKRQATRYVLRASLSELDIMHEAVESRLVILDRTLKKFDPSLTPVVERVVRMANAIYNVICYLSEARGPRAARYADIESIQRAETYCRGFEHKRALVNDELRKHGFGALAVDYKW